MQPDCLPFWTAKCAPNIDGGMFGVELGGSDFLTGAFDFLTSGVHSVAGDFDSDLGGSQIVTG